MKNKKKRKLKKKKKKEEEEKEKEEKNGVTQKKKKKKKKKKKRKKNEVLFERFLCRSSLLSLLACDVSACGLPSWFPTPTDDESSGPSSAVVSASG